MKKLRLYTHNLAYLAKLTKIIDDMTEGRVDFMDELEPLNIESRYPQYKTMISRILDEKKCNDLILKTKELQQWIKNEIIDIAKKYKEQLKRTGRVR